MKTGDRVILLDSIYESDGLAKGETGVILGFVDEYAAIKMDNGHSPERNSSEYPEAWLFEKSEIEVIRHD